MKQTKSQSQNWRYSLIVLKQLVKTDFKLRYQGSALGVAWSAIKPLLLFTVMYTVFVRFLKWTDGTPQFPVVLLLGMSLWQFFSEATNMGMRSIVDRGDMLRKIHFPNYIVVMSSTIGALISLAINMGVVLVFAIFNGATFTWRVVLLPITLAEYYLLTLGVTLLLATLFVYFRDIAHIWEVMLQVIFYAIPVIYPFAMVKKNVPQIAQLMLLDPLAQILQDVRHDFIDPVHVQTVWTETHSVTMTAVPYILTLAVLALGLYVFKRQSKHFTEVV